MTLQHTGHDHSSAESVTLHKVQVALWSQGEITRGTLWSQWLSILADPFTQTTKLEEQN